MPCGDAVTGDSIRGMVTAQRSLPLTWTATVWPPREERVSTWSGVRRVLGQGDERMDGTGVEEVVFVLACRTSHDSEAKAGAMGASRRRSDETDRYRIRGEEAGVEARVLVSLIRSEMTVFRL